MRPNVPYVDDYGEVITARVAAQLRDLRREKNLTLSAVAHLAELHLSTVGLIEQGKRGLTLATAVRLCAALDVRLSDLVREAEDQS